MTSVPKCPPHYGHDSNMVIPCSNKCGQVFECTRLDDHVANDCPLTMVDCEFKHVGCDVRLPRRDMPIHLGLAVVSHLSKQATCYEERLKMLKADNERLAEKCNLMESGLVRLENMLDEMSINLGILPKDSRQLKVDLNTTTMENHSQDTGTANYVYGIKPAKPFVCPSIMSEPSTPAVCLTMVNFEWYKRSNAHWVSPPFYTRAQGYKMCLRVTANGQDSGKDTHISVEICLMKGEFDDKLEWPFRRNIVIQLLNQQESNGHYTRTVYRAQAIQRSKKEEEHNINVWGFSKYKAHKELCPKYLKNDCLSFQIFSLDVPDPPMQELVTDV